MDAVNNQFSFIQNLIDQALQPPYVWVLIAIGILIALSILNTIWRSIQDAIARSQQKQQQIEADPAEYQKLRDYTSTLAATKFEQFLLSVEEKDDFMLLVTKLLPENQRHLGYKLLKAAQRVVEDNSEVAKIELERAATAMQMYLDAVKATQNK